MLWDLESLLGIFQLASSSAEVDFQTTGPSREKKMQIYSSYTCTYLKAYGLHFEKGVTD
jgi:hypothetical protein